MRRRIELRDLALIHQTVQGCKWPRNLMIDLKEFIDPPGHRATVKATYDVSDPVCACTGAVSGIENCNPTSLGKEFLQAIANVVGKCHYLACDYLSEARGQAATVSVSG